MNLLSIKNLTVTVGPAKILDDVNLNVNPGEITGIVGGSGSGKTTLGLSILKLLPSAMRMAGGQIFFSGQDLATYSNSQMRPVRGKDIGMVFQEPLSAFDPLFTIGFQTDETLAAHTNLDPNARRQRCLEVFRSVELDDPERIYKSYPHELSGGLRQRAMIAQAMICGPKLIIADEPTSSLDVTIQARIMKLLRRLNQEQGMTIILISHDLAMVSHLASHVAVMHKGKVIEEGKARDILSRPKQAYTQSLIDALT